MSDWPERLNDTLNDPEWIRKILNGKNTSALLDLLRALNPELKPKEKNDENL